MFKMFGSPNFQTADMRNVIRTFQLEDWSCRTTPPITIKWHVPLKNIGWKTSFLLKWSPVLGDMWFFCRLKPAPNKLKDTYEYLPTCDSPLCFLSQLDMFLRAFHTKPPLTLQPTRSPSTNEKQAKPYPIDGSNLVPLTPKKTTKTAWHVVFVGGRWEDFYGFSHLDYCWMWKVGGDFV